MSPRVSFLLTLVFGMIFGIMGNAFAGQPIGAQQSEPLAASQTALGAQEKIAVVEQLIAQGEQEYRDMGDAKNMLALAQAAFDRGDFVIAIDRAGQAETIAHVMLSRRDIMSYLYRYWLYLLSALLFAFLAGRSMYRNYHLRRLDQKILDLMGEEANSISLMKETQERHFTKKEISAAQYHRIMYDHQQHLRIVRSRLSWLRNERIRLVGRKKEAEYLRLEAEHLYTLISKAQEGHYVTKTVGEQEYHRIIDEYSERLAEIEESIMALQDAGADVLERIRARRIKKQSGKSIENFILPPKQLARARRIEQLKEVYEIQPVMVLLVSKNHDESAPRKDSQHEL